MTITESNTKNNPFTVMGFYEKLSTGQDQNWMLIFGIIIVVILVLFIPTKE